MDITELLWDSVGFYRSLDITELLWGSVRFYRSQLLWILLNCYGVQWGFIGPSCYGYH